MTEKQYFFDFNEFQSLISDLPSFEKVPPKYAKPSVIYLVAVDNCFYIGAFLLYIPHRNVVNLWGGTVRVDMENLSIDILGKPDENIEISGIKKNENLYLPSTELTMLVGQYANLVSTGENQI